MSARRLAILSHSETYYSTRRLHEAAVGLGFETTRIDPTRVVLRAAPVPAIFEDQVEIALPDLLLPRIGANLVSWSSALVDAWRSRGVACPITGAAITLCSDKLTTALTLAAHGIPTIPTLALREQFHVQPGVEAALPPNDQPGWVIKRPFGTGGTNVAFASDRQSALSFLGTLVADRSVALLQPFVATRPVRDMRVIIAGFEPLAACYRVAADGEFRANIHRGARPIAATADTLPDGALDLAVRAARALDLPFAGIDLIEGPSGLLVIEANASPGLQGIEEATGQDLATPFLERYAAWRAA
jgi:ribosomal protein S6--L-glutamate ligase